MNEATKKAVIVAVAKTIRGTSFLGIRGYQTLKGDISDYLIIAGYSHEQAMVDDFASLKANEAFVKEALKGEHSNEIINQAFQVVFDSLEKRLSSEEVKEKLREQGDKTIRQSDAQNDAYKFVAKGVRLHLETNIIHMIGLEVRKKSIVKGEYKEVKSRELTIVQNKIKKLCNFREGKIRNFKFDKQQLDNCEIKMQGITI